jgi:hypothetical protein
MKPWDGQTNDTSVDTSSVNNDGNDESNTDSADYG